MSASGNAASRINMALGQLITNEVMDRKLLNALVNVPREDFVPDAIKGACYVDDDLRIGHGRYLLSPLSFSRLLTQADLHAEDNVLVIGCVTGYSLAVISSLVERAIGCETQDDFVKQAKEKLKARGCDNVRVEKVAKLCDGYLSGAPYDKIIIEGGVRYLPEDIKELISEGGKLVTVEFKEDPEQLVQGYGWLVEYKRIDGEVYRKEVLEMAVPCLPDFEAPERFCFNQ